MTVTPATAACTPMGAASRVYANERGEFEAAVEAQSVSCLIVETTYGGATGRTTVPATSDRTSVEIQLEEIPPMTVAQGRALIEAFVAHLNGGPEELLSTFIVYGPEALRAAREDYQSLLGEKITATMTGREISSSHQRVNAELRGSKGGPISVAAYQDYSRILHSPLIDYSLRSRNYIAAFSRLVVSGDAERMARLLTAGDIDVPVEDARRVIEHYKPDFEVTGGAWELMALDESSNTLTYRVTWHGDGRETSANVVLIYGDGLLGLKE